MEKDIELQTEHGTWKIDTQVHGIIGKGAFGTVYKGTDDKGNTIAVKEINTKYYPRILQVDFQNLLKLPHPNIVKCYGIQNERENIWFIMEFCPFGDLNKFYYKKEIPSLHQFILWCKLQLELNIYIQKL